MWLIPVLRCYRNPEVSKVEGEKVCQAVNGHRRTCGTQWHDGGPILVTADGAPETGCGSGARAEGWGMLGQWRFRSPTSAPIVRKTEAAPGESSEHQGPGPTVTVALPVMLLALSVTVRV
jgi:hypothetical protein